MSIVPKGFKGLFGAVCLALSGTVLLLGTGTACLASDKISFVDSWSFAGPTSFFVLADQNGYFADEGLTVSLNRGYGSGAVPGYLASGTFQIGSGDINSMILFNAQNPTKRVRAVALIDDASPLAIVVKRSSRIASVKDLAGASLGAPPADAARQFFPLFANANQIDSGTVSWSSVQGTLRESLLVTDQVDGIGGFVTSMLTPLEIAGFPEDQLRIFRYRDFGVNFYGRVIMVSEEFSRANPDLVRRFLRAMFRALRETIADPAPAIVALLKRDPTLNYDFEMKQWLIQRSLIATPRVGQVGLSAIESERLQDAIDRVEELMASSHGARQTAAETYTDEFLPSRDLLVLAGR